MGQDRAKRKADLMAKVEALIEAMLKWDEETEAPNFGQLDTEILKLRRAFGEELLKDVVTNQEQVRPVPGPRCEQCGREMSYKGQKGKAVVSLAGEARIERGYYYCPVCESGLFPPG